MDNEKHHCKRSSSMSSKFSKNHYPMIMKTQLVITIKYSILRIFWKFKMEWKLDFESYVLLVRLKSKRIFFSILTSILVKKPKTIKYTTLWSIFTTFMAIKTSYWIQKLAYMKWKKLSRIIRLPTIVDTKSWIKSSIIDC